MYEVGTIDCQLVYVYVDNVCVYGELPTAGCFFLSVMNQSQSPFEAEYPTDMVRTICEFNLVLLDVFGFIQYAEVIRLSDMIESQPSSISGVPIDTDKSDDRG